MDLEAKIDLLRTSACVYDISFRNAGVGIMFYEGPPYPVDGWRKHLVIHKYYPTLGEAVDRELFRLNKL